MYICVTATVCKFLSRMYGTLNFMIDMGLKCVTSIKLNYSRIN